MTRKHLLDDADWIESHVYHEEEAAASETMRRLRRILAAVRAYACQRCGGDEYIFIPKIGQCFLCPDCRSFRNVADREPTK